MTNGQANGRGGGRRNRHHPGIRTDSNRPEFLAHGGSLIAGFGGSVLAEAPVPRETVLRGRIDLHALRELRTETTAHVLNPHHMLRSDLYAAEHARAAIHPDDAFARQPIGDTGDTCAVGQSAIDRRVAAGLLRRP